MRISSGGIDLAAVNHQATSWQRHSTEQRWVGARSPTAPARVAPAAPATAESAPPLRNADRGDAPGASLFEQLRDMAKRLRQDQSASLNPAGNDGASAAIDRADSDGRDSQPRQISKILEHMFGLKPISAITIEQTQFHDNTTINYQSTQQSTQDGSGYRSESTENLSVSSSSGFSASGTITTDDGRKLHFDLSYQMDYSLQISRSERVAMGDAAFANHGVSNDNDEAPGAPTPGTWRLFIDRNRSQQVDDYEKRLNPNSGGGSSQLHARDGQGWIDQMHATVRKLWDLQPPVKNLAERDGGRLGTAASDGERVRAGSNALSEISQAMQRIDLKA